jgi:HAD superfamily hydrolase (TIGR01490 family)
VEAAFFDLDKTVIAKASMVAFSSRFYAEGLLSRRTILRGLYGQLVYLHLGASEHKLERIRESVLALTRGWDQAQVKAIVAETLQEVVEPIIYREALDLIEEHRAAGRRVYIISASPAEIVEPLAGFLGADAAIASEALVDEEGRYTGEVAVYAYGPNKAELIRRAAALDGVDLEGSYAYSDSYTDLPMLEAVGHPVVVNPDRVLLRAARDRGWEIRKFEHPVRLRDRMPVPSRKATLAAVGLSGLAGSTVALVWMLRRRAGGAVRAPSPAKAGGAQPTRSFRTAKRVMPSRTAISRIFFMGLR